MARRSALLVFCLTLLSSASAQLLAAPAGQSHFFELVASGDASRVMSEMDANLQAEVDEPVLAAWMAAFNERLGPVTNLKLTGSTRRLGTNGLIAETSCEVTCQRGTAKSRLTVLHGKLIAFQVTSKKLANFFKGPTSTDIYEELGRDFLRKFLSGQADAAYALCHKGLQDIISLEQLKDMMPLVKPHIGQPTRFELTESRMEITDDADNLILNFNVTGNEGTVSCKITIEFVGLRGHLLGFKFRLQ
jgi:hypothetical protein